MGMPKILIHIELVRFPLVVFALMRGGIGRKDGRAVVEVDRYIAF